jgi:hypothetical protein
MISRIYVTFCCPLVGFYILDKKRLIKYCVETITLSLSVLSQTVSFGAVYGYCSNKTINLAINDIATSKKMVYNYSLRHFMQPNFWKLIIFFSTDQQQQKNARISQSIFPSVMLLLAITLILPTMSVLANHYFALFQQERSHL